MATKHLKPARALLGVLAVSLILLTSGVDSKRFVDRHRILQDVNNSGAIEEEVGQLGHE